MADSYKIKIKDAIITNYPYNLSPSNASPMQIGFKGPFHLAYNLNKDWSDGCQTKPREKEEERESEKYVDRKKISWM